MFGPDAGTEIFSLSYAGAIEQARGRPDEAIDLLRRAWPTMKQADQQYSQVFRRAILGQGAGGLGSIGQYAAPILARALEARDRIPEAIAALEEAGENRVLVAVGSLAQALNLPLNNWMRGRAQLARLYRRNGQRPEAEAVETHLRKLLALVDPDDPLLEELIHAQSEAAPERAAAQ